MLLLSPQGLPFPHTDSNPIVDFQHLNSSWKRLDIWNTPPARYSIYPERMGRCWLSWLLKFLHLLAAAQHTPKRQLPQPEERTQPFFSCPYTIPIESAGQDGDCLFASSDIFFPLLFISRYLFFDMIR